MERERERERMSGARKSSHGIGQATDFQSVMYTFKGRDVRALHDLPYGGGWEVQASHHLNT